MLLLPFLNCRQIGVTSQAYNRLNSDNLLSRLVCLRKDVYTITGEESEVPPFACKFRKDKDSDLLAVASEDGDILFYDTNSKEQKCVKCLSAHRNAIFDICWLPDRPHLLTASGDHKAALWDVSSSRLITSFRKHTASIKSIDVCPEQSAIFVTGSRDGVINVWDTREKKCTMLYDKPVITIENAHCRKTFLPIKGKKHSCKDVKSSVSSVAFQDIHNLASAGVADGVVKIWDLRKTYISSHLCIPAPRHMLGYSGANVSGHGCTSLSFDSRRKMLYACSTDHKIHRFDCHSYIKDAFTYEGLKCGTYFVKLALSYDDQYLLCGSSDDAAYIWKTTKPGLPVFELLGHSAEVTSVTWSPYDVTKLVTSGDDNKVLVWKTANLESITDDSEIVSSCALYSKDPVLKSNKEDLVLFTPKTKSSLDRLSVVTPCNSHTKVITNFFSPITSFKVKSDLVSKNIDDKQQTTVNDLTKDNCVLTNESSVSEICTQILSPCKVLNKNNIMPAFSLKQTDKRNELQNKKSHISLVVPSSSHNNDKENNKEITYIGTIRENTQALSIKRKLNLKQSASKIRRTSSNSKTKSNSRVVKKQSSAADRTLKNYFHVEISPKND
ncbi:denticleless protein homolog isoform X2 [Stegodyphus dumicola]|uniref:denticleless protein homolog isoform X2 n=1 Tax=Stegodyphus dumicola TaxID=202533 RepID=UPI0015A76F72|nr:denticleless protein homolog isoform X2 [Stegodyphus dumicola]